jgi:hypothetical protein
MTLVDFFLMYRFCFYFDDFIHNPQDSDAPLSLQLDFPIILMKGNGASPLLIPHV